MSFPRFRLGSPYFFCDTLLYSDLPPIEGCFPPFGAHWEPKSESVTITGLTTIFVCIDGWTTGPLHACFIWEIG